MRHYTYCRNDRNHQLIIRPQPQLHRLQRHHQQHQQVRTTSQRIHNLLRQQPPHKHQTLPPKLPSSRLPSHKPVLLLPHLSSRRQPHLSPTLLLLHRRLSPLTLKARRRPSLKHPRQPPILPAILPPRPPVVEIAPLVVADWAPALSLVSQLREA